MKIKTKERSGKLGVFSVFRRSFVENNSLQSAAALSYTSLFSLVPLAAVSLAIISAFPVFEALSRQMQDFVFENFVPASGAVIQQHLQDFLSKAKQLTVPGIFFLLVTALMMMATIERALNKIWKVRQRRTVFNRFIIYWSVISLGPLLIGGAIAMSSYVVSMPFFSGTATAVERTFGFIRVLPLFMELGAFSLLYIIVPNARVSARDAIIGGIFAASLFEVAKYGFTYFITHFGSYETLYGALATIPIFLIWLYVSWLVTLTGAEFTHSLQFVRLPSAATVTNRSLDAFTLSFILLEDLWHAQKTGDILSISDLSGNQPQVDERVVVDNLEVLRQKRVVERVGKKGWVLLRDLGRYSLLNLLRSCGYHLPLEPDSRFADLYPVHSLGSVLAPIHEVAEKHLDIPLADLYAKKPPVMVEKT